MDDKDILDLFFKRSDDALTETRARYGRLCYHIAENLLHDPRDAEECVNDTWLRAWNAIPPEYPRNLASWLAKVTRNLAISRLRADCAKKRGEKQVPLILDELAECVSGGRDPHQEAESRELAETINRFLSDLDREERDVFAARYFFAASIAELSRSTGWTQGKIRSMLQRTRGKLRNYLKEEDLL